MPVKPTATTAEAEDEEERQYVVGGQTLQELDEKYPNRPKNHSKTLLFSELYLNLFNPLNENKKQPSGPPRSKVGPHGPSKHSPQEQRRAIIERFISRWRKEVGNDFYPALRLILPASDRDRGNYGLKESNIGKLLVKLMKIDKNSEDGYNILHWKLPGQSAASRMAGDFAGRCFEVLSKRPMRIDPGDMTIADVNELLDKLAVALGEAEQLPIFETFYQRMNPEELMWLVRIILKQMKVGATERTFLDLWHPEGETLFSVSSSLRRVCWELHDPAFSLNKESQDVTIMQCFQPQLAQFQVSTSFQKMVERLNRSSPVEDDTEFWIEEKLDGERMQLHMIEDDSIRGGKRFCFWSRKAKDYTYLYGEGLYDENCALTRHLKSAFADGVRNIILDGEMITWDPTMDKIMPFGTLKTAALAEGRNPDAEGPRPVFRVFDILYLNDRPLARYTLRDRHNALEQAVPGAHRRLEVHPYTKATSADEIEPLLRRVVADSSEGLVLKNPRSMYRLNSRNDDWVKVKPEYMDEFGESVDVVVIGGFYGSGHRGGNLSSFLCGLRATENDIEAGANPEKHYSFCKVGGGFRAEDYAALRHETDGKWQKWDSKKPPTEYIELGGQAQGQQCEKPDMWIRPSQSVVISVKAASAGYSDQFAKQITLRFPRFRSLKLDKSWDAALNWQEFLDLKKGAEEQLKEAAMTIEKKRRAVKRVKKDVAIAGQDDVPPEFKGLATKIFAGLEMCILTEGVGPVKKTKTQLETLVKTNGGKVSQRANADNGQILIADKKVVKVASLIKAGEVDIIRPKWILDCLAQSDTDFLLPYEPSHLFHATDGVKAMAEDNIDEFGDSYARELDMEELKTLLKDMPKKEIANSQHAFDKELFLRQLSEHGHDSGATKGQIFRGLNVYLEEEHGFPEIASLRLRNWITFGGGHLVADINDETITQVVILAQDEVEEARLATSARSTISTRSPLPRVVTKQWVEDCWKNVTRVDEERYAPL
ncbi:ATP dependent DNA ligase domain-containing protein [Microdochium trichocladiopsis]|uniref:DNA ligase n=1 Tax=Microdochium trichocladiopsis TaxID=1682393 RepID=A0A9P8YIY4_9PEZI|nr:ATP dependent DNA ligase domain-containing protein [Microdochium trichocladiopsis]KAH7041239.1 ATP dependent DNA ligase domain-containing protein [Microdochium trichocladiopsis]